MSIPDYISELATILWVDQDPGSGILSTLTPGTEGRKIRIRDKHPGSATLVYS
jgi:hypothetical protein